MAKKIKAEIIHRAHLLFSGRVQGIGFRYAAEKIALEMGLLGWVKNLPDGRVESVCEASKEKIESFVQEIKSCSLGHHIKKVEIDWQKPTKEFKDFSIEFYY